MGYRSRHVTRFAIAGAANAIPEATATGYLPKWSNGLKFSAVRQPRAMVPARRAEWSIIPNVRPTRHGSLSFFTNQPENNKEGTTNRANFNLSGPLAGEALTMRLYGNIDKRNPTHGILTMRKTALTLRGAKDPQ